MSWIKSRRIDLWPYTRGPSIPSPVNYGTNIFVRQEFPIARMTHTPRMDFYPPTNNPPKVLFGNRITTQQQFPFDQYSRPQMVLEVPGMPGPLPSGIFVRQEFPLLAMTRPPLLQSPALAAGVWTEVWSRTLTVDDAGENGITFVGIIPLANLSAAGGSQIRVTVEGGAAEGCEISGLWVGNGTADFSVPAAVTITNVNQVQLKQGGNTTITVGISSTAVTDGAAFVKDASNDLTFAAQFTNAAADVTRRKGSEGAATMAFKAAADASTQNKVGYTDISVAGWYIMSKVELLIP